MKTYFAKQLNIEGGTKLFLCSRDIQVGDEFTTNQGLAYGETITCIVDTIDGNNLYVKDDTVAYSKPTLIDYEGWYKPVGEISPKAIWVKEGDEFDEGEFAFFWEQNDFDGFSSIKEGTDFYIFDEDYDDASRIREGWTKSEARILCPNCKTFH